MPNPTMWYYFPQPRMIYSSQESGRQYNAIAAPIDFSRLMGPAIGPHLPQVDAKSATTIIIIIAKFSQPA